MELKLIKIECKSKTILTVSNFLADAIQETTKLIKKI